MDPDSSSGTQSDLPMLKMLARGKKLRKGETRRQEVQDIDRLGGNEYPALPMPDAVIFPNLVSPLFIGRERSVRAVEAAEVLEAPA
jgi:hypothetical protein